MYAPAGSGGGHREPTAHVERSGAAHPRGLLGRANMPR